MVASKLEGLVIAVLPGTGRVGKSLAEKLAAADLSVVIGSRNAAKAERAAAEISALVHKPVKGVIMDEAAAAGDVIIWTIAGPLADREAILKSVSKHLEGKVIIDTTNIMYLLEDKDWGQVSSVLLNQTALAVPARWTTAWKNTFYKLIKDPPHPSKPSSVLVAGDDEEAVEITIALVESIPGFKGTRAGPLYYSKIVELLGPLWSLELDKLNAGGNWRSSFTYVDHDAELKENPK